MAERNYELNRISPFEWEIPATGAMRVPVRIFADAELLKGIESDNAVEQAINVAHMPGIVRASHGHAGRALGIRLPDRRRGGVRPSRTAASSRRAGSGSTSTAACGWCART